MIQICFPFFCDKNYNGVSVSTVWAEGSICPQDECVNSSRRRVCCSYCGREEALGGVPCADCLVSSYCTDSCRKIDAKNHRPVCLTAKEKVILSYNWRTKLPWSNFTEKMGEINIAMMASASKGNRQRGNQTPIWRLYGAKGCYAGTAGRNAVTHTCARSVTCCVTRLEFSPPATPSPQHNWMQY